MKVKINIKLLLVFFIVILLSTVLIFVFALNTKYLVNSNSFQDSILKQSDNNSALGIDIKYPESWISSELGGRSVEILDSKDKKIRILITKTPMLQKQSFKEYIKIVDDRGQDSNRILSENEIQIAGRKAIRRLVEPIAGSDLRQYVIIFIQDYNFVYSISATPADSELMPVFEDIVKSIKFQ